MNSIIKIALVLKLKFLLIILSLGSSYLVEHSIQKKRDAVPNIEIIQPVSNLKGTGDINAQSLFNGSEDGNDSMLRTSDHFRLHPVNNVSNRPFSYQGLEIYIVL